MTSFHAIQRRSHLMLVGAAAIERRWSEAILGVSRGHAPPPPRKIFKQTV